MQPARVSGEQVGRGRQGRDTSLREPRVGQVTLPDQIEDRLSTPGQGIGPAHSQGRVVRAGQVMLPVQSQGRVGRAGQETLLAHSERRQVRAGNRVGAEQAQGRLGQGQSQDMLSLDSGPTEEEMLAWSLIRMLHPDQIKEMMGQMREREGLVARARQRGRRRQGIPSQPHPRAGEQGSTPSSQGRPMPQGRLSPQGRSFPQGRSLPQGRSFSQERSFSQGRYSPQGISSTQGRQRLEEAATQLPPEEVRLGETSPPTPRPPSFNGAVGDLRG